MPPIVVPFKGVTFTIRVYALFLQLVWRVIGGLTSCTLPRTVATADFPDGMTRYTIFPVISTKWLTSIVTQYASTLLTPWVLMMFLQVYSVKDFRVDLVGYGMLE